MLNVFKVFSKDNTLVSTDVTLMSFKNFEKSQNINTFQVNGPFL